MDGVIKIPVRDQLIYNVRYIECWDKNIFSSKAITFNGYFFQSVEAVPLEGNPTILAVSVLNEGGVFIKLKL